MYSNRTEKPAGGMVNCLVGADGKKMPPNFLPQGLCINSEVYSVHPEGQHHPVGGEDARQCQERPLHIRWGSVSNEQEDNQLHQVHKDAVFGAE